jgi:hypothetical protein
MAELTSNKNYLQPTGFKLVISGDGYKNLSYFAQSVTHPGSSVNPTELPTQRITSVPLAGDKITYGELAVEIMLDEDIVAYKEMQNWLERIVNQGQDNAIGSEGTTRSTYADITLIIMSSHNNKNVQIKYFDALPTNVSPITLSSNVSDITYPTFSVNFRFSSFELL